MKITINTFIIALIRILYGFSQGFVNLNFESANVSGYSAGNGVPITSALPGWSAYSSYPSGVYSGGFASGATNVLTTVIYNAPSLGGPLVSIIDTNGGVPFQGRYSAILWDGGSFPLYSTTISQTGLVPTGTESLLFEGSALGAYFGVTINGQTINMNALQVFSNYTLYGGDISTFAGQVETLSFTLPPATLGQPSEFGLDNIQFSSSTVPEPNEICLTALGGFLLAWSRWKTRAI
jgi:hypothetical protein